jgi:hypothetical protein
MPVTDMYDHDILRGNTNPTTNNNNATHTSSSTNIGMSLSASQTPISPRHSTRMDDFSRSPGRNEVKNSWNFEGYVFFIQISKISLIG